MAVENGKRIMMGGAEDDPSCIHIADELIELNDEVVFMLLFKNAIPGFSVEEHTVQDYWFTGDTKRDPWKWRREITLSRMAAYTELDGDVEL